LDATGSPWLPSVVHVLHRYDYLQQAGGERRAILALSLAKRGRDPASFDLGPLAEQCAGERDTDDLRRLAQDLVPLFRAYEEKIKALREWARGRARVAGRESAVVDLFRKSGDS
jgi:hypothetical protein